MLPPLRNLALATIFTLTNSRATQRAAHITLPHSRAPMRSPLRMPMGVSSLVLGVTCLLLLSLVPGPAATVLCVHAQSATPIQSNALYTGTVAGSAYVYYRWVCDTSASVKVQLNRIGSTGDPDLYCNFGSSTAATRFPTTSNYDEYSASGSSTDSLTRVGIIGRTWICGVYGYSATTYTLAVLVTTPGGGYPTPVPDPALSAVRLTNGTDNRVDITEAASGASAYFTVGSTHSDPVISVRAASPTGPYTAFTVYVSAQSVPSRNSYTWRGTSSEPLIIPNPDLSLTYYVSVYADSPTWTGGVLMYALLPMPLLLTDGQVFTSSLSNSRAQVFHFDAVVDSTLRFVLLGMSGSVSLGVTRSEAAFPYGDYDIRNVREHANGTGRVFRQTEVFTSAASSMACTYSRTDSNSGATCRYTLTVTSSSSIPSQFALQATRVSPRRLLQFDAPSSLEGDLTTLSDHYSLLLVDPAADVRVRLQRVSAAPSATTTFDVYALSVAKAQSVGVSDQVSTTHYHWRALALSPTSFSQLTALRIRPSDSSFALGEVRIMVQARTAARYWISVGWEGGAGSAGYNSNSNAASTLTHSGMGCALSIASLLVALQFASRLL